MLIINNLQCNKIFEKNLKQIYYKVKFLFGLIKFLEK